MNVKHYILSLCIFLPILSGLIVWGLNRMQNLMRIRQISLFLALLSFLPTALVVTNFDMKEPLLQMIEFSEWIPIIKANYHLGVDGISLWFLPLTSLVTILAIVASWHSIDRHVGLYMGSFLVLTGLVQGAFLAQDALLFYLFFEATLIPMYLIIGIWGGPNRRYAAYKFFLYTLLGSLLMLLALILVYVKLGSFSLVEWRSMMKGPRSIDLQVVLFIAFFAAFAVKVPMWPFHTWLPDAHVEAPTAGSMVLAAIMLKLGTYGFLRIVLPVVPNAVLMAMPIMIALSLIAVFYIGLVALVQEDMKKLVAYSSVAHMAFVTLGLFCWNTQDAQSMEMALQGALVQMLSHGLISAGMFFCIGVLYDRVHSRQMKDYGGVVQTMPKFTAFAVFFAMANAALPGTSGFVGEFMVIMAAVKQHFWVGVMAATTLVIGAAYTLWMVKKVYFGEIRHSYINDLKDISHREFGVLAVLAALVLLMGVKPGWFTDYSKPAIQLLIRDMSIELKSQRANESSVNKFPSTGR